MLYCPLRRYRLLNLITEPSQLAVVMALSRAALIAFGHQYWFLGQVSLYTVQGVVLGYIIMSKRVTPMVRSIQAQFVTKTQEKLAELPEAMVASKSWMEEVVNSIKTTDPDGTAEEGYNCCSCLNSQDNGVPEEGGPAAESNPTVGAGSGSGATLPQGVDTNDTVVYKTLGCSQACVSKFGCVATPEFMLAAFTFGFLVWCEGVRKQWHGNEDHKAAMHAPTRL